MKNSSQNNFASASSEDSLAHSHEKTCAQFLISFYESGGIAPILEVIEARRPPHPRPKTGATSPPKGGEVMK
jgi:hypothetical protein